MTMSIAARCADERTVGVAISSSSICVGSRCAFVRAGVGAALTQNVTDPTLAPAALDAVQRGMSASSALAEVGVNNQTIEWRQLVLQPLVGAPAVFSGKHVLGTHAEAHGANCVAAGNLLANARVPTAMVKGFESGQGHLAARLIAALDAGLRAGGEAGPVHSASVLVAGDVSWPVVDLRVDWDDEAPISALRGLWERYAPQLADYVTRASHPDVAPRYGVAGDS